MLEDHMFLNPDTTQVLIFAPACIGLVDAVVIYVEVTRCCQVSPALHIYTVPPPCVRIGFTPAGYSKFLSPAKNQISICLRSQYSLNVPSIFFHHNSFGCVSIFCSFVIFLTTKIKFFFPKHSIIMIGERVQ